MFTELLRRAQALGASDVHVSVGKLPFARVNGALQSLAVEIVTAEEIQKFLATLLPSRELERFQKAGEVDFATEGFAGMRLRVNVYQEREGAAVALRLLSSEVPDCASLGLPPVVKSFAKLRQGLVLIAGATGSGKSTTLAALVKELNHSNAVHILTLEDPVEYVHTPKLALIHQREVGRDTASFASGLRSALREDPDVIVVGELRDAESIAIALTAAETGHLVLATVHTRDAVGTINRILDVLPSKEQARAQLAECLQAVACQTLLLRADGSGRVPAFEVLVTTEALRNLIREGRTHQLSSYIQMGAKYGMVTMEDYVKELRRQGII